VLLKFNDLDDCCDAVATHIHCANILFAKLRVHFSASKFSLLVKMLRKNINSHFR